MTKEIWKDIKGYEGLYQVSNLGRVKSLSKDEWNGMGWFKTKEKILKTHYDRQYEKITLFKDGKQSKKRIHRLVAEAFIPNPENKPYIDHINTIRNDNRVENLRWVTHKENMNNPLTKERLMKNSQNKKVICINTNKYFNSIREASEYYNCNRNSIGACCNGKLKSAGKLNGEKLIWKYLN